MSLPEYRDLLYAELGRMGAAEVLLTYNGSGADRMDPGVAAYFSLTRRQDYSWQEVTLGLISKNGSKYSLKEI